VRAGEVEGSGRHPSGSGTQPLVARSTPAPTAGTSPRLAIRRAGDAARDDGQAFSQSIQRETTGDRVGHHASVIVPSRSWRGAPSAGAARGGRSS
jgi:hypothetical protein